MPRIVNGVIVENARSRRIVRLSDFRSERKSMPAYNGVKLRGKGSNNTPMPESQRQNAKLARREPSVIELTDRYLSHPAGSDEALAALATLTDRLHSPRVIGQRNAG